MQMEAGADAWHAESGLSAGKCSEAVEVVHHGLGHEGLLDQLQRPIGTQPSSPRQRGHDWRLPMMQARRQVSLAARAADRGGHMGCARGGEGRSAHAPRRNACTCGDLTEWGSKAYVKKPSGVDYCNTLWFGVVWFGLVCLGSLPHDRARRPCFRPLRATAPHAGPRRSTTDRLT